MLGNLTINSGTFTGYLEYEGTNPFNEIRFIPEMPLCAVSFGHISKSGEH